MRGANSNPALYIKNIEIQKSVLVVLFSIIPNGGFKKIGDVNKVPCSITFFFKFLFSKPVPKNVNIGKKLIIKA